jgi:hypothetical protein
MRFVVGMVSIVGSVGYGATLWRLWDLDLLALPHFRSALFGFVLGAALWVVFRKRLSFFGVFEHELTHLIFGLLMFQRPRSFYASDRKGHVTTEGSNFIDNLAPYYFPTFSYILLAVFPLLRTGAHAYFYPLLGFLTGYHLISNITEFGIRQPDIRRSGVVFSIVFCIFAGILTFGFLAAFVIRGFHGGLDFLALGWHTARDLIIRGIQRA